MVCELFSALGDLKEWIFLLLGTVISFYFGYAVQERIEAKRRLARISALKKSICFNLKLSNIADAFLSKEGFHSFPFDSMGLDACIRDCTHDLAHEIIEKLQECRFQLDHINAKVAALNAGFRAVYIADPVGAEKAMGSERFRESCSSLKSQADEQRAALSVCLATICDCHKPRENS